MDGQSAAYFPYTGADTANELLFKSVLMQQRAELYNIGAPFNTYLLDDLAKGLVPEHKINIFLSTTQMTREERTAIEKQLKKNGNLLVFIFLSGIADGKDHRRLPAVRGDRYGSGGGQYREKTGRHRSGGKLRSLAYTGIGGRHLRRGGIPHAFTGYRRA